MPKISLTAFIMMWNAQLGRDTPDCHIKAAEFLQKSSNKKVVMCHRGFGKSSILALYNAWRYCEDPTYQILHQSESDPSARKISRATQSALRRHPLTKSKMPAGKLDVERWNLGDIDSLSDPLHFSMLAKGILSNVTGSRAKEAQNDDVEVPNTINTAEKREKLRERLDEQVHILVPDGLRLFIGTPHTFDSLYSELIEDGADHLIIKLFNQEKRFSKVEKGVAYPLDFIPSMVFTGIHRTTKLLEEGNHYHITGRSIIFANDFEGIIDCYAGVSWPERFTAQDILSRRRETRTINAWDSQYQLHSKPVTESRLDPNRLRLYDVEPEIIMANNEVSLVLGSTKIIGVVAWWDPSLGKITSDVSPFTILFTDAKGHLYWHVCEPLKGDLAVFGTNDQIVGGQVVQICDLVVRYQIPSVTIETNGVGGFAPNLLRQAFRSRNIQCGVAEEHATVNKQVRILEALEAPLQSRFLWAHVRLTDDDESSPTYTPALKQMRDFNPLVSEQPDDCIDSLAGAVLKTPIRIGKVVQNRTGETAKMSTWRPSKSQYKADIKY